MVICGVQAICELGVFKFVKNDKQPRTEAGESEGCVICRVCLAHEVGIPAYRSLVKPPMRASFFAAVIPMEPWGDVSIEASLSCVTC